MEAGTIDGIDVCNHCGGQMNQTTNEGRCMQCGAFDETTCENCGKRLYTNVDALLCKCGFEDLPGAGTVRFRLVRLNYPRLRFSRNVGKCKPQRPLRRRLMPATPSKPVPTNSSEAGSGAVVIGVALPLMKLVAKPGLLHAVTKTPHTKRELPESPILGPRTKGD